MNSWVCIDFGTCNTAAAVLVDGEPHMVGYGHQTWFPTLACVLDDGRIEVCQNAEPLRVSNAETFKQEFKLNIADDIDINGRTYTDIVAEILSFVKGCAELELGGERIDGAVLTVPALYTAADKRKQVMAEAARRAGFGEVEFLSEPHAAALHYAHICGKAGATGLTLIYDLGGGTFDPALLDISACGPKLLGADSGAQCGGHFFDRALYNHLAQQAKAADKPLERAGRLDDYAACRRMKEALSIKDTATQRLSNGQMAQVTRAEYERLIRPLVNLTLQSCDSLMATASRQWADVRRVLLVGGSASTPLIADMLRSHLISHNATAVEVVRNAKCAAGSYDHLYATPLGGITTKATKAAAPAEALARIVCNGRELKLHMGDNTFGRGRDQEHRFPDDPTMSRSHFVVTVTRDPNGRLSYALTTKSHTNPTIVNGTEILAADAAAQGLRASVMLSGGDTISAGRTLLKLIKT